MNTFLHHDWADALALDLAAAQSSARITTLSMQHPREPATTPHGRLFAALVAAVESGVRVGVSMPAPSRSHPATAYNNSAAAWLAERGIQVWWAPPANLLHAKTAIIDESIAWVGSGNWTRAACNHNRECYLRCESVNLAAQLAKHWRAVGLYGYDVEG